MRPDGLRTRFPALRLSRAPRPSATWLRLFAFCGLAVLLRWGTFSLSVIDHDESTYIVIADALLRGEVYLRDVIDIKPIGIFWIYAALIKLTGGSIPLLRLAAALVVGLGAWGLSLANWRATHRRVPGDIAGVAYCLMCSVFTDYGNSPNTELFFNLGTIAAVALAVAPRTGGRRADPFWHWPVAGLLLGLGCVIKPFVAAEALAVGLFGVWYYGRRHDFPRLLAAGAALVAGFALPVAGVVAYYAQLGLLDAFYFYTFTVAGAYPAELAWYPRLEFAANYLLRYAPLVLLGGGALVRRSFPAELRRWNVFLLLQFLLVTAAIVLTGKRFGHYQIQLHPVLALWVGACAGYAYREVWRRRWVIPTVGGLALLLGVTQAIYYGQKRDKGREVAAYFRERLLPGEEVFGMNAPQIAYHLLDRPSPTPYVHASLLYYDHHLAAFQIDLDHVAQRLIDNPRLTYLYGRTRDRQLDNALTHRLLEHFTEYDRFGPDQDFIVYRRNAAD